MSLLAIHPLSFILVAGYVLGMCQVSAVRSDPMWCPRKTKETRVDQAGAEYMTKARIVKTGGDFLVLAIVVGVCGRLRDRFIAARLFDSDQRLVALVFRSS